MKRKVIEVKRGNVVVKVYERERVKQGATYKEFVVADCSSGRRRMKQFNNLDAAKSKAAEIAEAIQQGNVECSRWESGLRVELRKALEAVEPTGMSILPACQLFAQAVQILGSPQDILSACQHWKQHGPEKPITPTSVQVVVEAYQASRKSRISHRRFRTETSYLQKFVREFPNRLIGEISSADIDLLVGKQKWSRKTRNDFLTTIKPLFTFAQGRSWMLKGGNPVQFVARAREARPAIEIFEPWEMRQMLDRLSTAAPDLVPFLAIWAFAGIRKDEIARMTWQQVNRALVTGHFELHGRDTKTGEPRTVPVQENVKAWLTEHRKDSGGILPAFWLAKTKSGSPRLDEITRFMSRKTGIAWRDNGPRHSYGTYLFKLNKDVGEVTRTMGTSLQKFERNYWNKSRVVTDESAKAWFAIKPERASNIVSLAASDNGIIIQENASVAAG